MQIGAGAEGAEHIHAGLVAFSPSKTETPNLKPLRFRPSTNKKKKQWQGLSLIYNTTLIRLLHHVAASFPT